MATPRILSKTVCHPIELTRNNSSSKTSFAANNGSALDKIGVLDEGDGQLGKEYKPSMLSNHDNDFS